MSSFVKFLMTFGVSILPIVELRGAIPIGIGYGLPWWQVYIASVLGNMLPVPIIVLFCSKFFAWLRRKSARYDKIVAYFEKKAEKKSEIVKKYSIIGLCLFVAVPLPGTGAWTGSMIASVMGLKLKDAFWSIFAGVLLAGVIVTAISMGVFAAIHLF